MPNPRKNKAQAAQRAEPDEERTVGLPSTSSAEAPAVGERPLYRTGNDYPVSDDDEAAGGPPRGGEEDDVYGEDDRDIYGEDDPLPEDEAELEAPPMEGDSPEATRAGPPRKLRVLDGPDQGKVKRFSGIRMVVGRTSACQLHLTDKSVSRRHLELIQGEKGVLLRDLGSGNGTKVNDERVNERLLQHEDVIEIGATRMQYVDELEAVRRAREEAERKEDEAKRAQEEEAQKKEKGEAEGEAEAKEPALAPEPVEQPQAAEPQPALGPWAALQPVQRLAAMGAAGAVGMFLLALLICGRPEEEAPLPDRRAQFATSRMDQARVAMMDGRYDDALELIESAEGASPGVDVDGLAKTARRELGAQHALERVRGFMEEGRLEEARAELDGMPEASPKWGQEREALRAELATRWLQLARQDVERALEALEVDRARELIGGLPAEEQGELLARVAEAEKDLARQSARRAESAAARRARERRAQAAAARARLAQAFRAVERRFHSGDFDRAVLECDRVLDANRGHEQIRQRAQSLKRLIPSFVRTWEDGQKKFAAGAVESSLRPLRRSRELYDRIGLPGTLGDQINERLLESLLVSARSASIRNDFSSAVSHYRDAKAIDPRDDRPREGLRHLGKRADELYMEGYVLRDRDPGAAIQRLRLVLEIAPRGSPPYEKAKRQLAILQP